MDAVFTLLTENMTMGIVSASLTGILEPVFQLFRILLGISNIWFRLILNYHPIKTGSFNLINRVPINLQNNTDRNRSPKPSTKRKSPPLSTNTKQIATANGARFHWILRTAQQRLFGLPIGIPLKQTNLQIKR